MADIGEEHFFDTLDAAIEKWKYVVTYKLCKGDYAGDSTCPLCREFTCDCVPDYDLCCPIYLDTGVPYCRNTPFYRTNMWQVRTYDEAKHHNDIEMLEYLHNLKHRIIAGEGPSTLCNAGIDWY